VTIRIDVATADDIPDLLASSAALIASDAGVHDAAVTDLGWAQRHGIAYCTGLIENDANLALLARDGDELVGHLAGRLSGPGSLHPIRVADLESIYVYPARRSAGAGAKLVAAFLAWAAGSGADRATVTAYAANEGAQRFYARHGFTARTVTLGLDDLPGPGTGQVAG
jgi:GNAT superfamily N-acetyltransferase